MTKPQMILQMILGMQLGNGYGSRPVAWRVPGVDPSNYTSFDAQVRYSLKSHIPGPQREEAR